MSEITVAIPSYNAAMYLPYVMSRLQHQKIPNLPVIVMDQGSMDGTNGLCGEWMGRNYFQKRSQEKNALHFNFFVRQQDQKNHPYVNAMAARQAMSKMIQTPYVFFLDPDVLIKPLALPRLLEELKDSGDMQYIGMKYEPDAADHPEIKFKHIMLGATLWRTPVFSRIPEFTNNDLKKGCDCNHCFRHARGVHSKISAEHLKGVFT